jgi:hypothetical protein
MSEYHKCAVCKHIIVTGYYGCDCTAMWGHRSGCASGQSYSDCITDETHKGAIPISKQEYYAYDAAKQNNRLAEWLNPTQQQRLDWDRLSRLPAIEAALKATYKQQRNISTETYNAIPRRKSAIYKLALEQAAEVASREMIELLGYTTYARYVASLGHWSAAKVYDHIKYDRSADCTPVNSILRQAFDDVEADTKANNRRHKTHTRNKLKAFAAFYHAEYNEAAPLTYIEWILSGKDRQLELTPRLVEELEKSDVELLRLNEEHLKAYHDTNDMYSEHEGLLQRLTNNPQLIDDYDIAGLLTVEGKHEGPSHNCC